MQNTTKYPQITEGSTWRARDARRNTGLVTIQSVIDDKLTIGSNMLAALVTYTRGGASRRYYTLLRNWHHRFKAATE